ncbi:MAG TPA: hypothetical protein VFF27_18705 [Bacteroidia bacterium]|jgi:hypothetical protein|nr:hypothetical protein [Bacteroidia bacterium]
MLLSNLFHTDHWCVKGIVDAPADEVFTQMLENLSPSAYKLLKLKKLDDTFHAVDTKHFEINASKRSIIIRGSYWYEGVFFATPIGNSTLITYRVNNIGEKSNILPGLSKWLIPLWQFNLPRKMRKHLQGFIQQIAKQLRCHAHLEQLRY